MVFPAPLEPTIATTAPAGNAQVDIFQDERPAVVREACAVKFDRFGETRQDFRSRLIHHFLGKIQESEDLPGSSGGLEEELVDVTDALDGLIGFNRAKTKTKNEPMVMR